MFKKLFLVLLILIFVLGAAVLGTLQLVSGNGENQKKGLESAFSMTLQGTAKIQTLHSFNLMPQFTINLEGLNVTSMPNMGEISADKLHIAFGLIDLSLGNRKIEVFEADNMRIGKGVMADAPIVLQTAKIIPMQNQKTGSAMGIFTLKGDVAKTPMVAELNMLAHSGARPSYSLDEQNNFVITLGNLTVTGVYAPFKADGKSVGEYRLTAYGDECMPPQDIWLSNKDFMARVIVPATRIKNKGDWLLYCAKIEEQK